LGGQRPPKHPHPPTNCVSPMIMKTSDKTIDGVFYLGWVSSGFFSFAITFALSWVPLSLIEKVVGDTILVAGKTRITEDYMLAYAFIPLYGVILGIIQYLLLSLKLPRMGWWVLTTTLGWSLAFLDIGLRYNPLGTINVPNSIWYSMLAGIILGIIIGVAQWLILRANVPKAIWWIPTNMLGFAIAGLIFGDISGLYEALVAVTIPSLCTAIVLWPLLKKLPRDETYERPERFQPIP